MLATKEEVANVQTTTCGGGASRAEYGKGEGLLSGQAGADPIPGGSERSYVCDGGGHRFWGVPQQRQAVRDAYPNGNRSRGCRGGGQRTSGEGCQVRRGRRARTQDR